MATDKDGPRSRPQETPRVSWVDCRRIQRRSTSSTGCSPAAVRTCAARERVEVQLRIQAVRPPGAPAVGIGLLPVDEPPHLDRRRLPRHVEDVLSADPVGVPARRWPGPLRQVVLFVVVDRIVGDECERQVVRRGPARRSCRPTSSTASATTPSGRIRRGFRPGCGWCSDAGGIDAAESGPADASAVGIGEQLGEPGPQFGRQGVERRGGHEADVDHVDEMHSVFQSESRELHDDEPVKIDDPIAVE